MFKKILTLALCIVCIALVATSCKYRIVWVDDNDTTTATQKATTPTELSNTTTETTPQQTTAIEPQTSSETTTTETVATTPEETTTETTTVTETATATETTSATTTRDPIVPITYPVVELVERKEDTDGWTYVRYKIALREGEEAKDFGYRIKYHWAASNPKVSFFIYPEFVTRLQNLPSSQFNAHFGLYFDGEYRNSTFSETSTDGKYTHDFSIVYGLNSNTKWHQGYDWIYLPGDRFGVKNKSLPNNIGDCVTDGTILPLTDGNVVDYQVKIFVLDESNEKTGIEFEEIVHVHYFSSVDGGLQIDELLGD